MADFPLQPLHADSENIAAISPMSLWSLGSGLMGSSAPAATAWPTANRAIFVPFVVPKPVTVYKIAVGCGTTAGGNFDAGIYDRFGNKLISTGTQARATSAEVVTDITDTTLYQGMYYMAVAVDGTGTIMCWAPARLDYCKMFGLRQMASAFNLPSTATYATMASSVIPNCSLLLRSN